MSKNLQTFCSSDVWNLLTSKFLQNGYAQQGDCIILQAISQSESFSQQRSSAPAFPKSADYVIRLRPGFNRAEVVMPQISYYYNMHSTVQLMNTLISCMTRIQHLFTASQTLWVMPVPPLTHPPPPHLPALV